MRWESLSWSLANADHFDHERSGEEGDERVYEQQVMQVLLSPAADDEKCRDDDAQQRDLLAAAFPRRMNEARGRKDGERLLPLPCQGDLLHVWNAEKP